MEFKRILISRTDSIGDVVQTLPLCAWLKQKHPNCTILFLGKSYTVPVLESFAAIDEIVDWSAIEKLPESEQLRAIQLLKVDVFIHVFPNKQLAKLAKQAKIPLRIGTSHRLFHLFTCNTRPNFTRKNSELREAQLNFELIRSLGLTEIPTLIEINQLVEGFKPVLKELSNNLLAEILVKPFVILHTKSQGSAKEWRFDNYIELAEKLAVLGIQSIFTGTENEGKSFKDLLPKKEFIHDVSGKTSLHELIFLISKAKGLVACSTGPLQISGLLNMKTVGLFSPKKPIHPGRWGALGENSHMLVFDEKCEKCMNNKPCDCINDIQTTTVINALLST